MRIKLTDEIDIDDRHYEGVIKDESEAIGTFIENIQTLIKDDDKEYREDRFPDFVSLLGLQLAHIKRHEFLYWTFEHHGGITSTAYYSPEGEFLFRFGW